MPLAFLVRKKTLASHGISLPASFSHTHWHRDRKRWAGVTDVGPALHWFDALCLAIIGLEQCWASVNVRQWWDSDDSLIKCPRILYRASPQNIYGAFSQC